MIVITKTDDPNYPVTVTGMTPTLINYVDLRLNTDGWRDEILGSAGGTYRRETLSSAILSFNYSAKLKVPCNFMLGFFEIKLSPSVRLRIPSFRPN